MVRKEIKLLSKDTIDKIAAGEVIERPSSVVKELTENSIDAGASAISVEIQDGGSTFIRVTDDGIGIPRDQISLAFLRHSTSKLREAEDLFHVQSLGFRGEALASIAAVSEVELLTKCKDEEIGSYFVIDGGLEGELKDIGAPDGTTFLIHHLFYNTPARKKFLKSNQTEANYIQTLLEHLALSHPEISFHLKVNGKERLMTSGNGKLKDAIYAVFGREITRNILPFEMENDLFKVSGFIGKYTINRGNRNFEYFFVNGRSIEDKILSKAVEDGYHGFLMQHQFPFVVLFLEFPDGSVDVNVHPTKREIRMDHGKEIYDLLSKGVHERLTQREDIQFVKLHEEKDSKTPKQTAEPFEKKMLHQVKKAVEEHVQEVVPNVFHEKETPYHANKISDQKTEPVQNIVPLQKTDPEQLSFLSEESRPYFEIVGQIFQTYWIIEFQGKVYLIDQHAAHEKVNYERFMERLRLSTIHSQMLMPPVILTLDSKEIDALEKYREEFEATGFRFESFGGKEYKLTGLPSNLPDVEPKTLFMAILSDMTEFHIHDTSEMIQEKIASMACKASIKGNQKISQREAEELITELLSLEEPYHCPHGRPTMIAVTRSEIDKLFKRIV
jgi:DNA mismatch repair protein MutL